MSNNFYKYCHIISKSQSVALAFSVVRKNGMEIYQCAVLDFTAREKKGSFEKRISVKGNTSHEDVFYTSKYCNFSLKNENGGKHLYCKFDTCFSHSCIEADITVSNISEYAHSGKGRTTDFVSAKGYVKTKNGEYEFSPEDDFGVFCECVDFQNISSRYGACVGFSDGKILGFCFGSKERAENRIFYDGKVFPCINAEITLPKGKITDTWKIQSQNSILKFEFKPSFNDRIDFTSPFFKVHGDRFFGNASGTLSVENSVISFDGLTALCERV